MPTKYLVLVITDRRPSKSASCRSKYPPPSPVPLPALSWPCPTPPRRDRAAAAARLSLSRNLNLTTSGQAVCDVAREQSASMRRTYACSLGALGRVKTLEETISPLTASLVFEFVHGGLELRAGRRGAEDFLFKSRDSIVVIPITIGGYRTSRKSWNGTNPLAL